MKHAGYFEGIGGFSLGAEWAGLETIYTCEINDFRNEWLTKYLPGARHERDIREAEGINADVFTAGFPCQDISVANAKGEGLKGERSGLFFDFFNLVRIYRPSYVVLENSPNLSNKGLRDILGCFTSIGYDAEWQVISKRAIGFSDQRKRMFFVAYTNEIGRHHDLQVFDKKHFKMLLKETKQRFEVWAENERICDESSLRKAHAFAISDDAGLSKELVKNEIESYGDAVCPYVATIVLQLIKIHYEKIKKRAV